jgi:hypothetical protein
MEKSAHERIQVRKVKARLRRLQHGFGYSAPQLE